MCGRFVQAADLDHWVGVLGIQRVLTEPLPPSWNVAPTDPVYAAADHEGERQLGSMQWGLIPHWANDRRGIHINARAETVTTKPAFRDAAARRRCLIPSNGFYEWQVTPRGKIPHHIGLADADMVFAGIWSSWRDPGTGERLRTVAIVTTAASPELEDIHDRMPVWLAPDLWSDWLDRSTTDPADVAAMLDQASPGTVTARPIGDAVGAVANNDPSLLDDRQDLFT
jgi:putative SOS response-associated peptidase YedK